MITYPEPPLGLRLDSLLTGERGLVSPMDRSPDEGDSGIKTMMSVRNKANKTNPKINL